jgi:UDP-N-acetylglucosamine acyltransferase
MYTGHTADNSPVFHYRMTGVHQFVKIGRNAMIGGMSRLTQDVVPYTIVAGQPAKVAGLNSVGISRAGIELSARRSLKQAYRILYRSGLSLQKAVEIIEQEVAPCEEVDHLLRFLRNADRGICRERRDDK